MDKQGNGDGNAEPMLWIISTTYSDCGDCGEQLEPNAHILWLPQKPLGKNNFCVRCGGTRASYPSLSFWRARELKLRDQRTGHAG